VLAILCPGQGSQTPGFLRPWLELSGVGDQLAGYSALAGIDLLRHGTTSDADTIRDTAVAQPLIVAAGLITFVALVGDLRPDPAVGVVAGHSVGEFTAAVLAGVLTPEQALVLVRDRGREMAAASALVPTGMSAVLGGVPEQVEAALVEHGLTPANLNGSGQVVAAGTLEQLAALAAAPAPRTRVVPLKVAGAFHTHHMSPAGHALARVAAGITPRTPRVRLLSNADGQVVTEAGQVLDRLVSQVANPVRWDLCQETLRDLGVTAVLELAPAGTLTGLAKRALPGIETLALTSPEDLPAARRLVAAHCPGSTAEPSGGPT
jgi:[acyl-carrier-protein] S-malonyltransferase